MGPARRKPLRRKGLRQSFTIMVSILKIRIKTINWAIAPPIENPPQAATSRPQGTTRKGFGYAAREAKASDSALWTA